MSKAGWGVAAAIGGTLLLALLADRYDRQVRRSRSVGFYDDDDDDDDDDVDDETAFDDEVDIPADIDLDAEDTVVEKRPSRRKDRKSSQYQEDEILQRFRKLIEVIEPTTGELEKYAVHQRTVGRRLEASLGASIMNMGSHARGTYLRNSSDLDLLAVLSPGSLLWGSTRKSSPTVLANIRANLRQRFRETEVSRSGPSVSLNFSQGEYIVDVVPAVQTPLSSSYEIPGYNGGWMVTDPLAHNRYLTDQDRSSRGKLRRVSMLTKFWARSRKSISIHSFTAEMIAADSGICRGARTYPECLHGVLARLLEYVDNPFPDPLGISDSLYVVPTPSKRDLVRRCLATSLKRLEQARAAEAQGDIHAAINHYHVIFNRNFIHRLR